SGGPAAKLSEGDQVDQCIEPSVSSTVQSVAHKTSRGCLQRRGSCVSGKLSVCPEPAPRSQDAGQRAGQDQADAVNFSQSIESRRRRICPDLSAQLASLLLRQPKALNKTAHSSGSLLVHLMHARRVIR